MYKPMACAGRSSPGAGFVATLLDDIPAAAEKSRAKRTDRHTTQQSEERIN